MKKLILFQILIFYFIGCSNTINKLDYEVVNVIKNDFTQFRLPLSICLYKNDIYIIDLLEPKIRMFSKDNGNLIHSTGMSGKGPGEFIKPIDMEFYKDTLFVYDFGLNRMNKMTPDLKYIGSKVYEEKYSGFEIPDNENIIFSIMSPDNRLIVDSFSNVIIDKEKIQKADSMSEQIQFNQIRYKIKDNFLYILYSALGILRKCDLNGNIRWEKKIKNKFYQNVRKPCINERGMLENEKYYHFCISDNYIFVLLGKEIKYLYDENIKSIIEVYTIEGKYVGNVDLKIEFARLIAENDYTLWLAGFESIYKINIRYN